MSIFLLKDKANNEFLLQANDFEQALKAYPKLNCVFELKSIELMKAPLYITDVQDLHAYTTPKDGRVIDKEYVRKSGTYYKDPKPVIQYDKQGKMITTYKSVAEAARINGLHASGISKVCRGKASHSGGYIWKFQ